MISSINPATGKVIKRFRESTKKEVEQAIATARIGQALWAARPKTDRIKILQNLKTVLGKNKAELFSIITEEVGYSAELESELQDILRGIDYYCACYYNLQPVRFPIDPDLKKTEIEVNFVAHGIVGHIGIWNYPFWQTMITAVPALLAGNAIVHKPSDFTTLTGQKIAELLYEAGVPREVYQLVIGGPSIGKQIVESTADCIVFTGGIATGRSIVKNAGIKPLILELSGNDAAIVCADCDMAQAVAGITFGTFLHAGQSCIRIKRVYVVKSIANEFISRLTERSTHLKLGIEVPPMIRDAARRKVHATVRDAVKKGAKLLLGGTLPSGKGFYYPPTILLIDNGALPVIKNETFGPVCSIMIVDDEDEAIWLANNSQYGLGGTIWSQDYEKAMRIAERLETGTVWINDAQLPLIAGEYNQGWKESSIPSSQDRLTSFMKKKTIMAHKSAQSRAWWS